MRKLLGVLNIIGFLTLPFYYGAQILKTNPLLWAFVPDCQIAALFFGIALLLGKFTQLGIALALKYGAWTLIVMILGFDYYAGPGYWLIFLAHVALFAESFILIKKLRFSAPVFVYLFLNDASDYLLGTHPPLPAGLIPLMAVITPLITGIILVASLREYLRKIIHH